MHYLLENPQSCVVHHSFIWNTWYGIYALYTSWVFTKETKRKVQKDETATSEGKIVPLEQILFIQKDDSIHKGNLHIHASHEVLHFQSFLCTLHRQIQKVKKWFYKMQKRHWQVWIVDKPTNSYFSTFV